MAYFALLDMPQNIDTIEFLRNEISGKSELELEIIRPNQLALKVIFDLLKIVTLAVGFLLFFKWTGRLKLIFFILLIMTLLFLYLDLPIHRCHNGALEPYWDVGRHFH